MFLRAIGRPLMARMKQTTGIVGLEVVENAREVLIGLYSKTLKEVQAIPEDQGYRKAVQAFTRHRLEICQQEEDWEAIEKRIGCGQVEELIEEARDELKLVGLMKEWDPWDVPEGYQMEIVDDDNPGPSQVPKHITIPIPAEEYNKVMEALGVTASKISEPEAASSSEAKP